MKHLDIKRKITLLLYILGIYQGMAQLSDLHYFPPLKQTTNNQAVQQQRIHLSTPETTPFDVNVFQGTSATAVATFTISNTAPATYTLGNGDNNVTLVNNTNTGVVLSNSGLRFISDNGEKFYVNFRGRSGAQAASLTCKGREAIGQSFKWGGVPNLGIISHISNTLGIMATEDNTTVTISGYDPDCVFRLQNDPDGITNNSITVTLNAHQSYVLETVVNNNNATYAPNATGFLGASIEADRPIVINNGGLNTSVFGTNVTRDAGIDQPVPIEKLGDEYVFIRANGTNILEFVVIIGTEDNTDIFVNGSATAIATIDEGEFFQIPGTNYSGTSAGSNMYVTTSENVYAYQNIGGSSSNATGGLNFVAPVNCEMPDVVDNIPDIRNVGGITMTGGVTIIASSSTPDANINITDGNGAVTLPASQTVTGTSDWKTFFISNLTGNVEVQSTGPIAVGFIGSSGARGVAGYFSGFDLVPGLTINITASITCIPSSPIEIQEDETFDGYQWYKDGVEIAGATGTNFTPTEVGTYQLEVIKGPCTYFSNNLFIRNCSIITNSRITYRVKKE
ncbi:MAG: IgGFc-binding protein [Flavobacteriaceae bacterium]